MDHVHPEVLMGSYTSCIYVPVNEQAHTARTCKIPPQPQQVAKSMHCSLFSVQVFVSYPSGPG